MIPRDPTTTTVETEAKTIFLEVEVPDVVVAVHGVAPHAVVRSDEEREDEDHP